MADGANIRRIANALSQSVDLEDAVNAKLAVFLADLAKQRKDLAALLASDLSSNNGAGLEKLLRMPELVVYFQSHADIANEPRERTAAGPTTQSSESELDSDTSWSEELAGEEGIVIADPNDYLSSCPCVVHDAETDHWIELRCVVCGTNHTHRRKKYLHSVPGMASHIIQMHRQQMKHSDVVQRCSFRNVSEEEVDKIMSGELRVAFVPPSEHTSFFPSPSGNHRSAAACSFGIGIQGQQLCLDPDDEELIDGDFDDKKFIDDNVSEDDSSDDEPDDQECEDAMDLE
ncbi:hypothetical protein CERZMDRAFT_103294 [Cercospora zeae-maydis SCOH1-5]|uniref:Uncharacterized protein n=1 Tax=Cercospora zeae-maydis SCOH1-5 TaxID=717836 RepID=A0A6A6EYH9_9PEZI|nr:hypothetical protein CERZMDRAFT_103294 [Cercospora zeae-maydis SCOH1-5]